MEQRSTVLSTVFATLAALAAAACVLAMIGLPRDEGIAMQADAMPRARALLDSPVAQALDPEGHASVAEIVDQPASPYHVGIGPSELAVAVQWHQWRARQTFILIVMPLVLVAAANVVACALARRRPDKKLWLIPTVLALTASLLTMVWAFEDAHFSSRVGLELHVLAMVTLTLTAVVARRMPDLTRDAADGRVPVAGTARRAGAT